MLLAYPVDVLEEPDGITITCPDVPGMVTGGWGDLAANLEAARDALALALDWFVEDGQPLPIPSPADGRPVVDVPLLAAAKLALHQAKLAAGLSNMGIARLLDIDEREVRRMLDVTHNTRISQIEAALRALNGRAVLALPDAA
jgi:antitoxin HicB